MAATSSGKLGETKNYLRLTNILEMIHKKLKSAPFLLFVLDDVSINIWPKFGIFA